MSRWAMLFVVGLSAAVGGCASSARVVQQDASRVVVAVPEDTDSFPNYYNSEAIKLAAAHISEPMRVSSTRVKVGETLENKQSGSRTDLIPRVDLQSSSSKSSVENKYEYLIEFQSRKVTSDPRQPNAPVPTPSPDGSMNWNMRSTNRPKVERPTSIPPVTTPTPGPVTGFSNDISSFGPPK